MTKKLIFIESQRSLRSELMRALKVSPPTFQVSSSPSFQPRRCAMQQYVVVVDIAIGDELLFRNDARAVHPVFDELKRRGCLFSEAIMYVLYTPRRPCTPL